MKNAFFYHYEADKGQAIVDFYTKDYESKLPGGGFTSNLRAESAICPATKNDLELEVFDFDRLISTDPQIQKTNGLHRAKKNKRYLHLHRKASYESVLEINNESTTICEKVIPLSEKKSITLLDKLKNIRLEGETAFL